MIGVVFFAVSGQKGIKKGLVTVVKNQKREGLYSSEEFDRFYFEYPIDNNAVDGRSIYSARDARRCITSGAMKVRRCQWCITAS